MNFALIHREFLLFAVGLCLTALAGFAWLHARRDHLRRPWLWLVATLGMLGLSNWILLLGQHRHDWPLCRLAALSLTVAPLVVLVELCRKRNHIHTPGALGRWLYAPLAIGLIAGLFFVDWSWLEFATRALLAWQGGALLLAYLLADHVEHSAPGERELTIAAWAILAYLPLQIVQLNILALLPLGAALVAVFVADRKRQPAGASRTVVRNLKIPTAMVAMLLVGWFVFAPQSDLGAVASHVASVSVDASDVVVASSPTAMMFWKIGLAVLPIGLMIALFAGLKRVPGVH